VQACFLWPLLLLLLLPAAHHSIVGHFSPLSSDTTTLADGDLVKM
jgi:hypothetical protein